MAAPSEIYISDFIDIPNHLGEGVSANAVSSQLAAVKGDVVVRINSPGRAALEGMAIDNVLKHHDGKVTTIVDCLAASAASLIPMAGSEIIVCQGAMVMVPEAWGYAWGEAADLEATAAMLRLLSKQYAQVYAERTGKSAEKGREDHAAETWIGADDAKALGFCDAEIAPHEGRRAAEDARLRARHGRIQESPADDACGSVEGRAAIAAREGRASRRRPPRARRSARFKISSSSRPSTRCLARSSRPWCAWSSPRPSERGRAPRAVLKRGATRRGRGRVRRPR